MNRWTKRLLVLAAIVVVILALRVTVFRAKPLPVTVHRIDRGRVEETVINSRAGTVESRRRAEMSPAIAGLVNAIPVDKGGRVRAGQVLLRLDDGEYRAQVTLAARSLDAAEASAEEACLTADQAARDLARAEGMARSNLISEGTLEDARTREGIARAACRAARQRVKQARAAVDAARAVLDKTVMAAPFDGVVLDITAEVGEWISPSPPGVFIPPVIDLIAPESLYVSAPIDEADVSRIRTGLPARVTLDAFRGRSFPARVSYIASFVETRQEQNRTLTVEAVFDETALPENLLPGLSADVEIILDARDDVLRVPTFALLEGNRALRVDGGKLAERAVEIGIRNWDYAEVTSGLSEGDRVVVSLDRPEVKAGASVTVTEEP